MTVPTLDEQIAAAQARLAAKQVALTAQTPPATPVAIGLPDYSVGQGLFDVLSGVGKAATGLTDIVTYPIAKSAQLAGYDVPTFGLTKKLESEIPGAAAALGVEPSTKVQKLVEFMTPIPGLSKGRMLKDALLGATAYGGSLLGEYFAPESPYAGLVGALTVPLGVQGAAALGKGAVRTVAPSVKVIAGNEAALKAAAEKEVLNVIGKEGFEALQQYAPAAPRVGAGDVPLTLAERVQTPTAAMYQNKIRQELGGANALVDALKARRSAIDTALEQVAAVPQQGVMAEAVQKVASEAATAKAAKEVAALKGLGLTDEALAKTPVERGDIVQQALMEQKAAAAVIPQAAWEAVDKRLKLDAGQAFKTALDSYNEIGPIGKQQLSSGTNVLFNRLRTIQSKQRGAEKGTLLLADLQDIRSGALNIIRNQPNISDTERSLVSKLVAQIDSDATKVIGEGASAEAWLKAREATRKFKQQFSEGVVGEITKIENYRPKLKTSQVVDRVLKYPENATELMRKFGPTSPQTAEVRMELLSRLSQHKKPGDFILKNKDTFRSVFGGEYSKVIEYARLKNTKTGLEQFQSIKDAAIPGRIFESAQTAETFAKQFKDSPILDMARGKFIDERLLKKGEPLDNLAYNKAIAQKLFGDKLPQVEQILRDRQILLSPAELQKRVTGGGSQTFMNTALGAIQSGRAGLELLRAPSVTGGFLGYGVGGVGAALVGTAVGARLNNLRTIRSNQIDSYISEILANPELLPLAAAKPTASAVDALTKALTRAGVFATRANQDISETTGIAEPQSVDNELAAAQARLAAKRAQLEQKGR